LEVIASSVLSITFCILTILKSSTKLAFKSIDSEYVVQ
jgi:hypothetical protein